MGWVAREWSEGGRVSLMGVLAEGGVGGVGGKGTELERTGECDGGGGGERLGAHERLDSHFTGSWGLNLWVRLGIYGPVREHTGKGCSGIWPRNTQT